MQHGVVLDVRPHVEAGLEALHQRTASLAIVVLWIIADGEESGAPLVRLQCQSVDIARLALQTQLVYQPIFLAHRMEHPLQIEQMRSMVGGTQAGC